MEQQTTTLADRIKKARTGTPYGAEEQLEQLIIFRLGGDEFGVRIEEVREIIKTGAITPIPDSPKFITGIINVRGEVIITIDLKSRFSLHLKRKIENLHIIVTREDRNPFGLVVDEVTQVMRLPKTDIKDTPGLVSKIHDDYVVGVVTLENRLIILLDLKKVLSENELVKLTDVQRKTATADLPAEALAKAGDADEEQITQKIKKEGKAKKTKKE